MTERPTVETPRPAPAPAPASAPTSTPASTPASAPAPTQAKDRAPTEPAQPSFTDRMRGRLDRFSNEHRANANPESPAAAKKAAGKARPPRRARLRLTRVDPWSVMKTSFLLSIAFGIVTVVSVLMVWSVLGAAGVWDSINSSVSAVLSSDGESTFNIEDYVGTSRILGFTVLVAAVDVLLLTAIATLGAFLYNMAAALLGGIEVTLAEDAQ